MQQVGSGRGWLHPGSGPGPRGWQPGLLGLVIGPWDLGGGLHTLGMTVPFSLLQRGSGEEKASFNGLSGPSPVGREGVRVVQATPTPRPQGPQVMAASTAAAQLCSTVTPWTVAHQAPLSMGFSRQE